MLTIYMFQEGEEANTTVDSETKEEEEAEPKEVKPPRELTAEELEAKVKGEDCGAGDCDEQKVETNHVVNDHSLFLNGKLSNMASFEDEMKVYSFSCSSLARRRRSK